MNINTFPCLFGYATIVSENDILYGVSIDHKAYGNIKSNHTKLSAKILSIIDNDEESLSVPISLEGTDFQSKVWNMLRFIPHGTTVTYKYIAKQIGMPTAIRAVANACGTNPIAILIPCHRVVRSDGGLGGYRWGTDIKEKLLIREGALY